MVRARLSTLYGSHFTARRVFKSSLAFGLIMTDGLDALLRFGAMILTDNHIQSAFTGHGFCHTSIRTCRLSIPSRSIHPIHPSTPQRHLPCLIHSVKVRRRARDAPAGFDCARSCIYAHIRRTVAVQHTRTREAVNLDPSTTCKMHQNGWRLPPAQLARSSHDA